MLLKYVFTMVRIFISLKVITENHIFLFIFQFNLPDTCVKHTYLLLLSKKFP